MFVFFILAAFESKYPNTWACTRRNDRAHHNCLSGRLQILAPWDRLRSSGLIVSLLSFDGNLHPSWAFKGHIHNTSVLPSLVASTLDLSKPSAFSLLSAHRSPFLTVWYPGCSCAMLSLQGRWVWSSLVVIWLSYVLHYHLYNSDFMWHLTLMVSKLLS